MAVTKIKPVKSTLKKALDYIQNPDKTDGKMLVSSFGCSPETADIEFAFTIAQALDRGNNLAHHLIQSFEPGEVDYQKAHEIGKQLADAVTKGQYEYVLTTHIDKGHVHNHIIFCAVNFVDHHKYNSNKRSYYGIRNMSDRLCRENGLSVVVPGKGSKGKSYAEYLAEKTGTSWKGKLKIAVDGLIPQVSSFEELLSRLQAAGYEIKPGKYVSCRAPGQERFTRLKTLGADYTEEAIRERIEGRRTRTAKLRIFRFRQRVHFGKGALCKLPHIRVHVGKRSVHVLPKLLPAPLMVNAQKVRFFHGKLCHAHTSISFCLVFAAAFFGAVFSLPAASCARTEGRILRIPLLLSSPLSISA